VIELLHGDCLERLRELPDCSVDACVTDPPYGLSFMGKAWDYDVPQVDVWREVLRVLKPGGHLLAFAGTRTQHRMAVQIEDAGFEIRDMIAWVYSTGFPKSHNLDRLRGAKVCGCPQPQPHNGAEAPAECDMRSVRHPDVQEAKSSGEERRKVLLSGVPQQGAPAHGQSEDFPSNAGIAEPFMERRSDASQAQGQLRASPLPACAPMGGGNGATRRLRDGAPASDGGVVRLPTDSDRVRSSFGSQSAQQQASELGAVAGQPEPQAGGAWPICRGCGLPVVPSGWGTALKPALEPITVARKPFKGTVAANVLEHGTGALNVDGCRVGSTRGVPASLSKSKSSNTYGFGATAGHERELDPNVGRWPANLIHDGSDEPCALLGDAARFFYCAKASKADRGDGNGHPTVKPTELMRYLCRLVTPPGGTVLDPFMGSGSTGKAAALEGFRFIGIEREAEYLEIARQRVQVGDVQRSLL
jgi:site-specific DNA-methyltransferase (adenine-specific)